MLGRDPLDRGPFNAARLELDRAPVFEGPQRTDRQAPGDAFEQRPHIAFVPDVIALELGQLQLSFVHLAEQILQARLRRIETHAATSSIISSNHFAMRASNSLWMVHTFLNSAKAQRP